MGYWDNKIVAITGGSAGFGLELARVLIGRGATVFILGRSEKNNELAVEELSQLGLESGGRAFARCVDMQSAEMAQETAQQIVDQEGRLDAWVNNVGRSTRKALDDTTPDDYRAFLEINLLTAVHGTDAARPFLEKTNGHLVNIGSLSSKTAWPFLAPYTVSKFALAGYTEQVRLESENRFHVLLVCPGPMTRKDSGQRYESETATLPSKATAPGAGAPVRLLDPTEIALAILSACEKRQPEILRPYKIRLLTALRALFPKLGWWMLDRSARKK